MYVSNADEHDLIWVGINSNPEEQYKANDYWFNNGSKLAKLPVTTPQVIDTWQGLFLKLLQVSRLRGLF